MFDFPLTGALIPIMFIAGFVAIWMFIIRLLRRVSRMTDTIPAMAGERLAKTRWGDALVNGSKGSNSIRVEKYVSGHAVKMHPIFGGGLIWLPSGSIEQVEADEHRLQLRSGGHDITLFGPLARFMLDDGADHSTAHAARHAIDISRVPQVVERGTGLAAPQHKRRGWLRWALALALLMLGYVVLRRMAPELTAPLDALLGR
ncbi:hypothetical protein [Nitrogeniibacter aestuarii]|uniref:hypothetical protein n=1 Tax=Nitrogeniibacter aestuarii TaxID=2815343 RepID=UPI001D128907|nr:hypothetical protein [Nitrogeniibacter aestuarii]